jgi:hypothetical protein
MPISQKSGHGGKTSGREAREEWDFPRDPIRGKARRTGRELVRVPGLSQGCSSILQEENVMTKQEAFQSVRYAIARRQSLLGERQVERQRHLVLEHVRAELARAEAAVLSFRDYILATEAGYCSEHELLAANKAMVLRAEYRKLASVDSCREYQELAFEADVLEDQFLILAKGV